MNGNIVIDPEFQAVFPTSAEERKCLEANIIAFGFARDPLVVWKDKNGKTILLDGHNRYEICTRLNLPYRTVEIELEDREAAEAWIDDNQLGRRNLTPDQFRLILGRKYNRAKKLHGGDRKSSGQNAHLISKTAEAIGSEHGVNEKTVRRAAKFAAEVDSNPELRKRVESGEPARPMKREPEQPRSHPVEHTTAGSKQPESQQDAATGKADEAIAILDGIPRKDKFRRNALNKVKWWLHLNIDS